MKAKCDDCHQEVELTLDDRAKKHSTPGTEEDCPGIGYRPIHIPYRQVWEISGGHFESSRRKH